MMNAIKNTELATICGASRNGGWDGRDSVSKGKGAYGGVDSCGAGIFGGLITGSLGGPAGMAVGIIGGIVAGQCTVDSFSKGSSSGNNGSKSGSNFGGQCTW